MNLLKKILASVYFLALIYLVFFTSSRKSVKQHFIFIVPLKNTIHTFNSLHLKDDREVKNFYYNIFGNIILFVPFSFVLPGVFGIRDKKTIFIYAVLFSVLIECIQYIFEIGVADIDDVLLNAIGASLGLFLYRRTRKIS